MEAPEAEPLRPAAPSAVPRPCARLPCALAAGAAAAATAVAARASWSARGWKEGWPAGDPVSASQERWAKREDTICTNFDDIKVGGAMVRSTVPACIFECQKSDECVAVSHISGADWEGSHGVGAGACFLLGAGCQEEHSNQSQHWHLYTRTESEVVQEVSHHSEVASSAHLSESPPHSEPELAEAPHLHPSSDQSVLEAAIAKAESELAAANASQAVAMAESALAEATEKGVWETWPKTGCGNWDALRLGDVSITGSLEECQALCASLPSCYAVNRQPEDCGEAQRACPRCAPGEPPAYVKGACSAYGRGSEGEGCQQGENVCWDLYIKSA